MSEDDKKIDYLEVDDGNGQNYVCYFITLNLLLNQKNLLRFLNFYSHIVRILI